MLRKVCTEVVANEFNDFQRIASIGRQLLEITRENNGYGLSANQVGLTERIFVMRNTETEKEYIFANPKITRRSGEKLDFEGCLSIPMQRIKIKRAGTIDLEYFDWYFGKKQEATFDEMEARCIQHEVDHLDGILLPDHINSNLAQKRFFEKYSKDMKQARRKGLFL